MACTALLTGVPPLTPASLTDFERVLRNCDLDPQVIPFGDRFCPNNLLTVRVAMRQKPGMNVFF